MEILQHISFDEIDNVKKLYVDFIIKSDHEDVRQITHDLQITPTIAFNNGDKYIAQRYNPETGKKTPVITRHTSSIWRLHTEHLSNEKRRVEEHIAYLLDILEPKKEIIEKYLQQKETYTVNFFIYWQPIDEWGSYVLNAEMLKRISALCHDVEFEFSYFLDKDGK